MDFLPFRSTFLVAYSFTERSLTSDVLTTGIDSAFLDTSPLPSFAHAVVPSPSSTDLRRQEVTFSLLVLEGRCPLSELPSQHRRI